VYLEWAPAKNSTTTRTRVQPRIISIDEVPDMTDAVLVLTTVPSADVGTALADALVGARLAACVNVLPPMTSIYRWKGDVQHDSECQMIVKTVRARIEAVRALVRQAHPYQLPEFVVVPVETGDDGYLAWLAAEASGDPE
jgi:periplasmic divalent cation tolerance protein